MLWNQVSVKHLIASVVKAERSATALANDVPTI